MNQRTLLLSQRALPMHQINLWMVANQNCSNGTSRRRCLTLWATRVSCCSTRPGRRERARSRAPELFLPIKVAVDEDPRPGRFLLTGSANVLLLPKLADSLAGRIGILTLCPFSQGELAGCGKLHRQRLLERIPAPPANRRTEGCRYIERLAELPSLPSLLASRAGSLLKRYMALLETAFLVHYLPAWSANLGSDWLKLPR